MRGRREAGCPRLSSGGSPSPHPTSQDSQVHLVPPLDPYTRLDSTRLAHTGMAAPLAPRPTLADNPPSLSSLRTSLRSATRDCLDRNLAHAAKFAGQLLAALPAPTPRSRSPAVAHPEPGPSRSTPHHHHSPSPHVHFRTSTPVKNASGASGDAPLTTGLGGAPGPSGARPSLSGLLPLGSFRGGRPAGGGGARDSSAASSPWARPRPPSSNAAPPPSTSTTTCAPAPAPALTRRATSPRTMKSRGGESGTRETSTSRTCMRSRSRMHGRTSC